MTEHDSWLDEQTETWGCFLHNICQGGNVFDVIEEDTEPLTLSPRQDPAIIDLLRTVDPKCFDD